MPHRTITAQTLEPDAVNAAKARRSLRNGFITLALAYQIGDLSNFIPVPGGIGVLDGSLIAMLVLYGLGGTEATAATLVYHAIALWVPAMWGTIAFVGLQKTKQQPVVLRNAPEGLRAQ